MSDRTWNAGDPEPSDARQVRDVHGDVWTRGSFGVWSSPETAHASWWYVAKKWAPLTEVLPTTGDPSPADVLACPMDDNDAGADTIRAYLVALLAELWKQGEGFGGKRPFGNSGWEYELYGALAKAGYVKATFDDGYLDDVDIKAGDRLIAAAIESLGVAAGSAAETPAGVDR
jgi:hypothetical protein